MAWDGSRRAPPDPPRAANDERAAGAPVAGCGALAPCTRAVNAGQPGTAGQPARCRRRRGRKQARLRPCLQAWAFKHGPQTPPKARLWSPLLKQGRSRGETGQRFRRPAWVVGRARRGGSPLAGLGGAAEGSDDPPGSLEGQRRASPALPAAWQPWAGLKPTRYPARRSSGRPGFRRGRVGPPSSATEAEGPVSGRWGRTLTLCCRVPSALHAVPRPDYNPRLRRRLRPNGAAERCQSGRSGRSRKPLCLRGYRGFESHPLRQPSSQAGPLRFTGRRKILRAISTADLTFQAAAESCIAVHCKGLTDRKHAAQRSSTMARHVYPIVGDKAAMTSPRMACGPRSGTGRAKRPTLPPTCARRHSRIHRPEAKLAARVSGSSRCASVRASGRAQAT